MSTLEAEASARIREAVERGVRLLDEYFGSRQTWVQQINPDILHLESCERCILGQLFFDYLDGVYHLRIEGARSGFDYGFDYAGSSYEGWKALENEWLAILNEEGQSDDALES